MQNEEIKKDTLSFSQVPRIRRTNCEIEKYENNQFFPANQMYGIRIFQQIPWQPQIINIITPMNQQDLLVYHSKFKSGEGGCFNSSFPSILTSTLPGSPITSDLTLYKKP